MRLREGGQGPDDQGESTCPPQVPLALMLFVRHVLLHPSRLREAWKDTAWTRT
jgi:hypothetical protein